MYMHRCTKTWMCKNLLSVAKINLLYSLRIILSTYAAVPFGFACRYRWQASSVRFATWRSATNQRSALTTTLRMLTAAADLTPGTSARFATGSSRRNAAWSVTCHLFTALAKYRCFHVTSARGSLKRNTIWKGICQPFIAPTTPRRLSETLILSFHLQPPQERRCINYYDKYAMYLYLDFVFPPLRNFVGVFYFVVCLVSTLVI